MTLRDLKIGTRLGLGFALVLALASATGLVAVLQVPRLAEVMHTFHDHPFTVNVSLRDVRLAVAQLQERTRLAAHATDPAERLRLLGEIDDLEARVHALFEVIAERYLGDPKDVRDAHDLFRNWRPIRESLLATARLEGGAVALRMVERQSADHLARFDAELQDVVDFAGRKAASLNAEATLLHERTLALLYALLGSTLLAGLLLSVAITRSIARPLRRVVGQVQRVSQGELTVELGASARDEVGELARAVEEMVQALRAAIGQAGRVARGDFSATLQARTERDQLGEALGAMTTALRDTAEENRRAGWLKVGQAQLDDVLRGDRRVGEVADTAVAFLARYLDAPVGALYAAAPDGRLELSGRYALPAGGTHPTSWKPGEGLVGQAASERRTILATVPPEYLQASSGLGAAPVRAVAVVPLTRGEAVLGVLELGALSPFGEDALTLLEEAAGPLAVALQSARARLQLQEALAVSQDQAQHLQVQQEELRVANEELTEHAAQLRESRGRLQDQQEELRSSNEELEEKTAELEEQASSLEAQNRRLAAAQRELEAQAEALAGASRYKSQFLANMSHELRTPLNSLLLLARSLIDNRTGNLSEDQVESARVIQKSGQDLLHLINEVLDLSKIEAGRMEAVLEPVPLREAAAALAREFIHVAEDKGLELAVEISPDAPATLQTDRQRLEQILRNLVSNALKFTPSGRVVVGVAPGPAGPAGAPTVTFTVEDSGIGISEAHQRLVFEAFHQGDGGTARRFGGTGLGLTISRELAQLLGGTLTLVSTPGRGSTFTLLLPVDPPRVDAGRPAPGQPGPGASPLPPAPPQRVAASAVPTLLDDREVLAPGDRVVLVVEDDATFAELLRRHCHQQGFKCLLAPEGRAGLELAAAHRPAAVILDILLPGMDGWAVLDALKRTPDLRHIPVHMMSAQSASIDALRRGAVAFLEKPVTAEDLDAAFARIRRLDERELRRLLVVEDDDTLRRQVVALVGGGDVACVEAATGEEALQALRGGSFDCVVLDLGLSDMTGFDLLDRLHAEGVAVPPVIIYTGRELSREEAERLQRYAESVIVKGVKSAERLLDETSLFLHRVVSELPESQRRMIASLHDQDALFAGKRVLLVDDDMRNTFALAKLLRERDLEVHIASDGAQALAFLEQHPDVDVVLMDIMMPELDGYEATRRIRAQERFRRLPIIALTAKAMKDDRERCMQAGVSDYLPKPVDLERLLSMLRVWLYS